MMASNEEKSAPRNEQCSSSESQTTVFDTNSFNLDTVQPAPAVPSSSSSTTWSVITANPNGLEQIEKDEDVVYFDPHASIPFSTKDGVEFNITPLVDVPKPPPAPKRRRKNVTVLPRAKEESALRLQCEWGECREEFDEMKAFMAHVGEHVPSTKIVFGSEEDDEEEDEDVGDEDFFACLWRDCGYQTPDSKEIVRHVHFHSFHTKIKGEGEAIIRQTGMTPCLLLEEQRNILPDLTDPFRCLWQECPLKKEDFEQAQSFYWHCQWHAEEYRGNRGGAYKCLWGDCDSKAHSVSKMKEHLRVHSQERVVGCPVCGGLFSNRSKFFDHCKRQTKSGQDGTSFKCSYCGKLFSIERLLRDHMRSHVNSYKCPLCDMTVSTPANLDVHMVYKHSDERHFACELCDYKGKREVDLAAHHGRVHEGLKFECVQCEFTCRSLATLKSHNTKEHTAEGALYCCHICQMRFVRGNYLTKHLNNIHSFHWPSGHSRFRYRKDDEDGLFKLQTVRFESAELAEDNQEEIVDDPNTQEGQEQ